MDDNLNTLETGEQSELTICWQNHNKTVLSVFDLLLSTNTFVDMTIACEGKRIHAHRIVLAACSEYFQELLSDEKNPHPIIYLKDVKYRHMLALVAHMYRGHFRILKEELPDLIRIAEGLKIRGIGNTVEIANTADAYDDSNGYITQEQSEQETSGEIPLLFYTELLQNPDKQELLAGKITQCLDTISKNPSSGGDEVVKTVSSMTEKDILDTFFEDFFEIDGGGFDSALPLTDLSVLQSQSTEPNQSSSNEEELPNNSDLVLPSTNPQTSNESETGVCVSNEISSDSMINLGEVGVVEEPTTIAVSTSHEVSTNYATCPDISNTKVPGMRTVITVIEDGYRKAIIQEKTNAPLVQTKSKRKSTTAKKRRVPVTVTPNSIFPLDTWSLLGRRSINPKIPDENTILVNTNQNSEDSFASDAPSDTPMRSPSPEELSIQIQDDNLYRSPLPVPIVMSPALPSSQPTPEILLDVIEPTKNETMISTTATTTMVTTSATRRLSKCLVQSVQKLLKGRVVQPENPAPSIVPRFSSVHKDQPFSNFLRPRSLSTPRKRPRHIRNLHFKTPPSLRETSPATQPVGEIMKDNHLSRDFENKKELEWWNTNYSNLERIEELDETAEPMVPVTSSWNPPPTPRVISPANRDFLISSPWIRTPSKTSPERNYFTTLQRFLGSPLAPGMVPNTPGQHLTKLCEEPVIAVTPPFKRLRITEKDKKEPESVQNEEADSTFVLPEKPNPTSEPPQGTSTTMPPQKIPSSGKANKVKLASWAKERVPALMKSTLPFPKTGFCFDPIADPKPPKMLYQVGKRQKVITISGRRTLVDIPDTITEESKPKENSRLQLLLDNEPENAYKKRRIVRNDDQVVSYNDEGQIVKHCDAPVTYSFDEHLRTLMLRGFGGGGGGST